MARLKTAAWILALAAAAAGCSGTDAIDLSAAPRDSGSRTAPGAATTTTLSDQSTVGAQTGQQVAAVARDARIEFAPVIGAAPETVSPLSSRLSSRAGQRGLTITPEAQGATLVVKGYFSTISDEKGTSVIFVWDVLDPAGNRLHRIQGQEKATGTGEGWTAVTGANMEAIADRTIDELAAWLQGGQARS
ncbi:hypothetical protein [Chelativorans sp. AA-79]|uniref:hypothetical protein n=1 Tax=Chelativorans sp. AA-79 TaxID=3028735 RepID=UPI0023F97B81|nr:hypothetical protein [Chelativorans sp. AA-79]WEX07891.1 hypothetical protein PVE73_17560 [Chelativorans sp. AA-79]